MDKAQLLNRFLTIYKRKSLKERKSLAATFIKSFPGLFPQRGACEAMQVIMQAGLLHLRRQGERSNETVMINYVESVLLLVEASYLLAETNEPPDFTIKNYQLN